jgi:cytochrome c oxidase assembly protein subunit 15
MVQGVRAVHRLAASGAAILALAALVFAWRARGASRAPTMAAGVLVLAAFLLSVLGVVTGRSLAPAVALANVLGGMTMLALFAYVMFGGWATAMRPLAMIAIAMLAAQIALGVMTSAAAGPPPSADTFGAFALSGETARARLQLAHGLTGSLTAGVLLALALHAGRGARADRTWALGLGLLVAAELAAGMSLALLDLPLAAASVHSAIAAALLVAVVRVGCYSSRSEAAAVSALCQMRTSNQPSGTNVQR